MVMHNCMLREEHIMLWHRDRKLLMAGLYVLIANKSTLESVSRPSSRI